MKTELMLFMLTFIFMFLIYEIFIVRSAKKNKDNKKKKKPVEVLYITKKFNIDIKDINYNQLLQVIAIVSSFDIALVVSIMYLIDNFILEIVIGFILIFIVIFVSYNFIGRIYRKKVNKHD